MALAYSGAGQVDRLATSGSELQQAGGGDSIGRDARATSREQPIEAAHPRLWRLERRSPEWTRAASSPGMGRRHLSQDRRDTSRRYRSGAGRAAATISAGTATGIERAGRAVRASAQLFRSGRPVSADEYTVMPVLPVLAHSRAARRWCCRPVAEAAALPRPDNDDGEHIPTASAAKSPKMVIRSPLHPSCQRSPQMSWAERWAPV
jgi:hypothetical protein